MVAAASALALTAIWLYLCGLSALGRLWTHRAAPGAKPHKEELKEIFLIQPFERLMNRFRLFDSLQLPLGGYHMKLLVLKGQHWTFEATKREVAASVGSGYAVWTACAWAGLLGGEPLLAPIGLLLGIVLVCRPFAEAGRKLERRKQQIVAALPDMLGKLILLVGAGETVQRAFVRCLDGKEQADHPLSKEWRAAVQSLQSGHSFSAVMERFNRNCAVQEAAVFTTVLLLNYRRGGDYFVLALRELIYTLWERRKAIARSKGEEASSKLVFPLVGILLIMMVLIAAPAMMLIS